MKSYNSWPFGTLRLVPCSCWNHCLNCWMSSFLRILFLTSPVFSTLSTTNAAMWSWPFLYLFDALITTSQSSTKPSVSYASFTNILAKTGANSGSFSFNALSFIKTYGVSSVCASPSSINFDRKSHLRIRLQVPSSLLSISNKLFVQTTNLNWGINVSLSQYNSLPWIGSPPVSSFMIPSFNFTPFDGSCITA